MEPKTIQEETTTIQKDNITQEEWKPIQGFDGKYEISNFGNVRSLKTNKLLKLQDNGRGQVSISISNKSKIKTFIVSRLVAKSFLFKPVGKNYVCHKDSNAKNNNVNNLYWGTAVDNERDKISNKSTNRGGANYNTNLTDDDVINMHKLYLAGVSQDDLAAKYNVLSKTVNSIINFRSWKHLHDKIKPDENLLFVKKQPYVLVGGEFVDDRGMIKFYNKFDFTGIRRAYCVQNIGSNMIRAWHGHEREGKVFDVIFGTVLIGAVNMKTEKIEKFVLSDKGSPKLLWIPPGYANGFMNLTDESLVQIYSTSTVDESKNDDIRFPFDKWNIWDIQYR